MSLPYENELSTRRKRFYREYLIDHNGTQAAIRAKYSERSAHVTATRLLSDVKGVAYMMALIDEQNKRLEITADDVIREFARIALADVRKLRNPDGSFKPIVELDDDTAAAISEIEHHEMTGAVKKVKLNSKTAALTKLGEHFRLFTDEDKKSTEINIHLHGKAKDL